MKAIVTGGAGFIGSNIVDHLIDQGYHVTVIDNESSQTNSKFYWNCKAHNYKYDVSSSQYMIRLFKGVDVVFHLAADASIQSSINNPLQSIKNNIVGTATVLEYARMCGVKRFIYSSTSAAYGIPCSSAISEDTPKHSLNAYSISKTAGEDICKLYADMYGMETVIFRYFNVYGERQPIQGEYAPVIGTFFRQSFTGQPMTIVGDGNQTRDFVHISDVVSANILAATFVPSAEYQWGQIYNIGSGTSHSILQIASMIGGNIVSVPARNAEIRYSLADISKVKRDLGWKPKVDLRDWITRYKYSHRK